MVISACVSRGVSGPGLSGRTVQPYEMRQHTQLVLVTWEAPLTALLILVNPFLVEGRL